MRKKILIFGEVVPGIQLQGRNLSAVPDPEKISGISYVLYGRGIERARFFKERGLEPVLYAAAGDDTNGFLLEKLLREQEIAYTLKKVPGEETGSALLSGTKPVCFFPGSCLMEAQAAAGADAVILEAENLDQEQTEAFLDLFEQIHKHSGLCMTDLGEISGRWVLDYSRKLIEASDLVCFRLSEEAMEDEWIPSSTPFVFRNPSGRWIYRTAAEDMDAVLDTEVFYALLMNVKPARMPEYSTEPEEKKAQDWVIPVPSAAGVASSLEEASRREQNENLEIFELSISTGYRDPLPLQAFLRRELEPEMIQAKPGGLLQVSGRGYNCKNRIALLLADRHEVQYYDLSVRSAD